MTTHPSDQARIARWDHAVLLTLNASRTNYGLAPVTELPKPLTFGSSNVYKCRSISSPTNLTAVYRGDTTDEARQQFCAAFGSDPRDVVVVMKS